MSRRRVAIAVALLVSATVAAACGSSSESSSPPATTAPSAAVIPAPHGLPAFYAVPRALPAGAGVIVKSEPVAVAGLHGQMFRVMYTSKALDGHVIAVTGVVALPSKAASPGGRPIVSWAHGTNGMADECAPSLHPASDLPLANALLDHGWIVAATDYRGEGTPGIHPYIAGTAAARDTMDIARAARRIPHAQASGDYVVWGHSQGGHTAMFALHLGRSYAPDMKLRGVVAGAPPSQFKYLYAYLKTSPFKYYLLMAGGGLNRAYGDARAPLDKVLTPYGISLLPILDKGCSDYVAKQLAPIDFNKVVKADPWTVPAWRATLASDDPQNFVKPSPFPLLIIQGGNDEQIPVASTKLLADHLCGLGQDLSRWIYPGQSHAGVIGPSANDMMRWIADRFAGEPTPDSYKPTGEANVDVTTCPPK